MARAIARRRCWLIVVRKGNAWRRTSGHAAASKNVPETVPQPIDSSALASGVPGFPKRLVFGRLQKYSALFSFSQERLHLLRPKPARRDRPISNDRRSPRVEKRASPTARPRLTSYFHWITSYWQPVNASVCAVKIAPGVTVSGAPPRVWLVCHSGWLQSGWPAEPGIKAVASTVKFAEPSVGGAGVWFWPETKVPMLGVAAAM